VKGRHPRRPAARPRFLGSIGFLILVFNILLVFLPVAAFYFLDSFEKQLLRDLERTMSEQALLAATALRGDAGSLAERAAFFVESLGRGHEARIRVFSAQGSVLADSARIGTIPAAIPAERAAAAPGAEPRAKSAPQREEPGRDSLLYRLGSLPVRAYRRIFRAPSGGGDGSDLFDRSGSFAEAPEIAAALAGRYGSTTRILPGAEGSTVRLYSALPIRSGGTRNPEGIAGLVLVSQSTLRILGELDSMRIDIFRIFLLSAFVAVILSLVSDLLLGRPLRALAARAAGILDRKGRLRGSFPRLRAPGEVGVLSRALADMGSKLERRTAFLESFSQDLAHEIRNPLASVRASLELLEEGEAEEGRRRLFGRARSDLERINHLVGDIRELASLDSEEPGPPSGPCRPLELARGLAEGFASRHPGLGLELRLGPGAEGGPEAAADPRRFVQALDNLLENAASFAPPGSAVELSLELAGEGLRRRWVVGLRDRGPGFPPGEEERLFERFYSTRKADGLHTGLGLAIVRSLAEAWGGSVRAELARPGARFVLELPCSPAH